MQKHYFQWQKSYVGSENSRVIYDLELTKNVPLAGWGSYTVIKAYTHSHFRPKFGHEKEVLATQKSLATGGNMYRKLGAHGCNWREN